MFEFDQYVSAISDTNITGIDPRSDVSPTSTYYSLKDLRNQLRAAERNALVDEEGISSIARDWAPLLEQCSLAIKNESKDIEYLAWFIESLCRLYGFKGLSFGFKVAHHLIENYFDSLFPLLDLEDDPFEKLAAIIGLNGISNEGTLIIPIKSIYITEEASIGAFTFWEYQQAYDTSILSVEKKNKKLSNGALDYEQVEKSALETSTQYFVELKNNVESAIEEFALLSNVMDKVTGLPQPTSNIKKALESSLAAINHIAADKLLEAERAAERLLHVDSDDEESDGSIKPSKETNLNGVITSRVDAIRKLQEIATFFRKAEPHSPMSYTIEQVIRWSDLSLPELLNELIADNDARTGYFKLSGIKVNETET